MRKFTRNMILAATAAVVPAVPTLAAPYVSGITVTGTTVSFILNENADSLSLSVNGGAPSALPATRGAQSFTLASPTDTFSLTASKVDANGWSIPNGTTVATQVNALSIDSNGSALNLISDGTNLLNRFNSPRGVSINNNPRAGALFGTAYVANSASGTAGGRAVGDGIYALHADQSDRFGFGDAAQTGGITAWATTPSASAPFRLHVGRDNTLFIADFSDLTGTVWRMGPNLTNGTNVLAGVGGPTALPAGQNHGSSTAVYTEGSIATGDLVLYTLDEDLTDAQFGSAISNNRNSLWRYELGSNETPSTVTPTRINANNVLLPLATSDMDRGLVDGKFYLSQNRGIGAVQVNDTSLIVLNPDGTTAFNSLEASRALLGDLAASDILKNIIAMDVSDDQKWMVLMLNNSKVCVVPLINGIPDIANRLVVDSGSINSGRDIAFDAANNIHYVSSGQAIYRVLSPGGTTVAVTSWDGTNFSFVLNPATTLLKGDFNFDGEVLDSDISLFVSALTGDFASLVAQFPTRSEADFTFIGDFNSDGEVLDSDITGFVAALLGGGGRVAAIPEPAALGLLAPLGLLLGRRRRA